MNMTVFIEPSERAEAIGAYSDRLSCENVEEIDNAPETAIIRLDFCSDVAKTKVTVIEEG